MKSRLMIALAAAGAIMFCGAVTAHAGPDPDIGKIEDGRTVGSRITLTGNGLKGGTSSGGYSMPQPCWYEKSDTTPGDWYKDRTRPDPDAPKDGADEYEKGFKKGKKGPGEWWRLAYSKGTGGPACAAGYESWFFQQEGDGPPPAAISLEQLAMIARAALTVPEPNVRVNPAGKSFVNMDTWVWATGIGDTRRSVTATLEGFASVTVTATLQDLGIEPGTSADRASVKENCGPKGFEYGKGKSFRCGVTYLRSAADQPGEAYTLSAITTWNVTSNVLDFDPIVLSAEEEVPVDEVQAVTE